MKMCQRPIPIALQILLFALLPVDKITISLSLSLFVCVRISLSSAIPYKAYENHYLNLCYKNCVSQNWSYILGHKKIWI